MDSTVRLPWIILVALSVVSTAVAADFTGTWQLNIAKSKLAAPVTSETLKIEQTGPNTFRTTIDQSGPGGEKIHQEIIRIYDGKEHPVRGVGIPPGNRSEVCEVNGAVRKVIQKLDGKEFAELTTTISGDGKVMTSVRTGQGAETRVLDKQ